MDEALPLRDGTELRVRPIEAGDKGALRSAFHRLSPESRYRRFFSPLTDLSERDLAYLTEIDHADHEALIALTTDPLRGSPAIDPASEEIVGVARYVRTEGDRAEASIVVADEWHERGIATGLLERLAGRAREEGISHFVAIALPDNREVIDLFEHLAPEGLERRTRDGHLELELELPEPGELEGSALARALREAARGVVTLNPWPILADAIRRTWQGRSR